MILSLYSILYISITSEGIKISRQNFGQKVPLGYSVSRLKVVEIGIELFTPPDIEYVAQCLWPTFYRKYRYACEIYYRNSENF